MANERERLLASPFTGNVHAIVLERRARTVG